MILTCPSCATRYYADDASIGPNGRTVRCAACSKTWFAEPQASMESLTGGYGYADDRPPLTRERVERLRRAAQQVTQGPAPSAAARFRAQQAERQRKERVRAAVLAWGATGAAVAATTTTAVAFRQDVATVWPETASAFAMIGLDVNVYGLDFAGLQVERSFDGPTPVLIVRGEVTNISRDDKAVPAVRLALRDDSGAEVYHWIVSLGDSVAPAGGTLPFEARLENPPTDAADLELAFASASESDMALQAAAARAPEAAPAADHAADQASAAPEGEDPLVLDHEVEGGVSHIGGPVSFYEPHPAPGLEGSPDGLASRLSTDAGLRLGVAG